MFPAASDRVRQLAIVVLTLSLVGCSPDNGSDTTVPGSTPVGSGQTSTPNSATNDELPLDWFARLQSEYDARESELYFGYMERCMAEAGFLWESPAAVSVPLEWAEVTRYPPRYGVVTLEQAELAAYQTPEEVFSDGAASEEESLPSDPAEREAFLAVWGGEDSLPGTLLEITDPVSGEVLVALEESAPVGRGCQGAANMWLFGALADVSVIDVTATPEITRAWVSHRVSEAFREALADPRVLAVADGWRECMVSQDWELSQSWFPGGIVRDTSLDSSIAGDDYASTLIRLEAERQNTLLAVADVQCQQQVAWLTSLRAVERERQQAVVELVPDIFAQARDILEAYGERLSSLRVEDLDF